MATGIWKGANNGTWDVLGNWSANIDGTGVVNPVPGTGDIAYFSANGISGSRNVYLNGNRPLGTLWLNGNATGTITILGGTSGSPSTQTLTLGGVDMSGTFADVSFGSSANVALANNATFSVGSGRTITLNGILSGAFTFQHTGAGSTVLNGVNIYSGATTVTTGTLTVGSSGSLGSGSYSAAITNNGTLSFASSATQTLSGAMTGTGGLIRSSTGILALTSGSSTYSGNTTINAGTVRVGASSTGAVTSGPLGTGTVFMTGGTLSSNSTTGYTLANALSLIGTVAITDATNNGQLTFTGIQSVSGTTSLSVANIVDFQGIFGGTGGFSFTHTSGQLWLTGTASSTYNGAYTVNGGTTFVGRGGTLPNQLASAASITLTSGNLYFGGSSAYQVTTPISGAGGILYARNQNASGLTFTNASAYSNVIRIYMTAFDGAASTVQSATFTNWPTNATTWGFLQQNTAIASGTQTIKYTGTASVGTVTPLTSTVSLNSTVAATSVWHLAPSNGTASMAIGGAVTSISSVANTFELKNDSTGELSFSGGIAQNGAGVVTLIKNGNGPVTLSGTSTFTGAVSVTTGRLNANSATALGSASSTAGISVTSGAMLSLGGASNVTYSSRTVALAGTGVSNAGALVVANAVTNTFSGITLTAGTLIRGTESGTLTAPITTGDFVLTFTVADTKTLTFPSVIGASGTTVATNTLSGDTGTLVLSAQSLYTGPTTVNRGTVRVGASSVGSPGSVTSGPLGRGQITWNGGALDASTTATLGNNVALGGNVSFGGTAALTLAGTVSLDTSRTITTNGSGGALTLSGVVSGTGFRLTKAGINTLVLSNASNSYSGGTTINGGDISVSNNGNLGASGAEVVIDGGQLTATASFSINNRTIKLGGSYNYGVINVSSGQTLVSFASLQNNGSVSSLLYKDGTGQLDIRGNFNYYSDGTIVNAGTLRTNGPQPLGTGPVFLSLGSTLQLASVAGPGTINLTIAALTNSAGGTIKIGG